MRIQLTLAASSLATLALMASKVAANPKEDQAEFFFTNAQLAGFGQEYDEYCCDDFDRKAPDAGHHRVLEGCANEGAMSACYCGLLQDYILHDNTDVNSGMTTRDDGSNRNAGTLCVNGNAGGYPCDNVNLLSFVPLRLFDADGNSNNDANDIWGWSYDDAGTRREFALIGLTDGTGMVEITDPLNPVVLGRLGSPAGNSLWRDIKIYQNYAYVVSERGNHGLQIFDLTTLLTASQVSFTNFSPTLTWGTFRAHNIFVNEDTGYAYLSGPKNAAGSFYCGGGMYILDIRNPTSPGAIGCTINDYTHDAQCVIYNGPDTTYQGREICFLSNTNRVVIQDVTDHANPVTLSERRYTASQYTHQGWLSPDHTYFVFGDELDETRNNIDTTIFSMDVTDLNNPGVPGRYVAEDRAAIDHNLYIKSFGTGEDAVDLIFLANYQAGMRILKVNDYSDVGLSSSTTGFQEIGFFDTFPGGDDAAYNGAWSVFPFFESGTVIVSSIGEGLFVLRPDIFEYLPLDQPTASSSPSKNPSQEPSNTPSRAPTDVPSSEPSLSSAPSSIPTDLPSGSPSGEPSGSPSKAPTDIPSATPSDIPSAKPTNSPSLEPSTSPSKIPTRAPVETPSVSMHPTGSPSVSPSKSPTSEPSSSPSNVPSMVPSLSPSGIPSTEPSSVPSSQPSLSPSSHPSALPSLKPSTAPSLRPSSRPSVSIEPSASPSSSPSSTPSSEPSKSPTSLPSASPSASPLSQPAELPVLTVDDWDDFDWDGNRVRNVNKGGRPAVELETRSNNNSDPPRITSPTLHVDGYCRLEINLSVYTQGFDRNSNDGLLVQYLDSNDDWQSVEFLNRGDEFASNSVWYDDIIVSFDLPPGLTETQLRFINTANRSRERISLGPITAIAYSDCTPAPTPVPTSSPSSTPTAAPVDEIVTPEPAGGRDWELISFNDFENDMGDFIDGGSDAAWVSTNGQFFGDSPNNSIRLRDNSGRASSIYTDLLPISPAYSQIRIEFEFYALSMENGEDFFVEIAFNGDSNWRIFGQLVRGVHFQNGILYEDVVGTFNIPNGGGRDGMWLRFRCDASGNSDYIFLDNIAVYGM